MTNNRIPDNPRFIPAAQRNKKRRESYVFSIVAIILSSVLMASVALNVFLLSDRKNASKLNSTEAETNYVSKSESESSSESESESESVGDVIPSEKIEKYEEMIDEYEEELEALREMVESYADAAQNNFEEQSAAFASLLSLLKTENRPIHNHAKENEDDPDVSTPAEVAFMYVDLETGFSFGFNSDKVMYSASIVKAPYLYSVFQEIEEFEYNKRNFTADGEALYDENGKPLFSGDHPNLDAEGNIIYLKGEEKYDLSREWVYNSKTMFVEGSGEIQKKKDGFTLTYLELAEYALKYSDNIAFSQFTKAFGRDYYNSLSESLGATGYKKGFMQLTANDCGIFLREIYEYFETDSVYAVSMKKAMTNSMHSVIIPPAVKGYECAHKYGWDVDSYHDMAIVYHDRPFAVIVFTDLDEGRYADNAYIQKIVKNLLSIHDSFTPDNLNGEQT